MSCVSYYLSFVSGNTLAFVVCPDASQVDGWSSSRVESPGRIDIQVGITLKHCLRPEANLPSPRTISWVCAFDDFQGT